MLFTQLGIFLGSYKRKKKHHLGEVKDRKISIQETSLCLICKKNKTQASVGHICPGIMWISPGVHTCT